MEAAGQIIGYLSRAVQAVSTNGTIFDSSETAKKDLDSVVNRLQTENIFLQHTLRRLLKGVVADNTIHALMQDPFGTTWSSLESEVHLGSVGDSTQTIFQNTLMEMRLAATNLCQLLRMEDNEEHTTKSSSWLSKMKARTSLRRKRRDLESNIAQIREGNTVLGNLVTSGRNRMPSKYRTRSPAGASGSSIPLRDPDSCRPQGDLGDHRSHTGVSSELLAKLRVQQIESTDNDLWNDLRKRLASISEGNYVKDERIDSSSKSTESLRHDYGKEYGQTLIDISDESWTKLTFVETDTLKVKLPGDQHREDHQVKSFLQRERGSNKWWCNVTTNEGTHKVDFVADTVSTSNWISNPLRKRLGLESKRGDIVEMLNYTDEFLCDEYVDMALVGKDWLKDTVRFYIAPRDMPVDILFGKSFIQKHPEAFLFEEPMLQLVTPQSLVQSDEKQKIEFKSMEEPVTTLESGRTNSPVAPPTDAGTYSSTTDKAPIEHLVHVEPPQSPRKKQPRIKTINRSRRNAMSIPKRSPPAKEGMTLEDDEKIHKFDDLRNNMLAQGYNLSGIWSTDHGDWIEYKYQNRSVEDLRAVNEKDDDREDETHRDYSDITTMMPSGTLGPETHSGQFSDNSLPQKSSVDQSESSRLGRFEKTVLKYLGERDILLKNALDDSLDQSRSEGDFNESPAETSGFVSKSTTRWGSDSLSTGSTMLESGSVPSARPFSLVSTIESSLPTGLTSISLNQSGSPSTGSTRALVEDDDDTSTQYTTRNTLSPDNADFYTSEVADIVYMDVCGEYGQGNAKDVNECSMDRLNARLPDVLHNFAIRLGHDAQTKDSGKRDEIFEVMRFIHRNRKRIATTFKHKYQHDSSSLESETAEHDVQRTGVPPTDISSWLNSVDDTGVDDLKSNSEADHEKEIHAGDIDSQQIIFQRYRNLTDDTPAFKWFKDCLRRELYLCSSPADTMNGIRQSLVDSLLPPSTFSATQAARNFPVRFQVDWDPASFLRQQQYEEKDDVALENAITLTQSAAGPQAARCRDYLSQVWPTTGILTLTTVQRSLNVQLGTGCNECIQDIRIASSKLIVDTCGSASAVAEVAEQVAWLGAALRCRPETDKTPPGLMYCRPVIESVCTASDPKFDQTWDIRFATRSQDIHDSNPPYSLCWTDLFWSPVVVEGYPTLSRPDDANSIGLDIPLHMVAQLLRSRGVTTFKGQVFVKGFCAMLILSRVLDNSDTFVWHLVTNKNGRHISYHDYNLTGPLPYDLGLEMSLLPRLLEGGRHIVGWCNEAQGLAGTGTHDDLYKIRESHLQAAESRNGSSYWFQEIHKSSSKMVVIGRSDLGVALRRSQDATYDERLALARTWSFVFYDTHDARGWFVDGVSTLLHLIRRSLAIYQKDPDTGSQFCFELEQNPSGNKPSDGNSTDQKPSGGSSSYGILKSDANRCQKLRTGFDESFQDKVEQIWSKLDWVVAQQEVMNGDSRNILGKAQGFQFVDIARDLPHRIRLCMAKLEPAKSTWLNLTRIQWSQTAVLFGQGFGELIKPSQGSCDELCHNWRALPKGEGYLAARVRDIEDSVGNNRYYGSKSWQFRDGKFTWHWFAPIDSASCSLRHEPGDTRCCEKAHVIIPDDAVKMIAAGALTSPQSSMPECGAIVFGFSSKCPRYWELGQFSEGPAADVDSCAGSTTSRPSHSSSFGLTTSSSHWDSVSDSRLSRWNSDRSPICQDSEDENTTSQRYSIVQPAEPGVAPAAGTVLGPDETGMRFRPGSDDRSTELPTQDGKLQMMQRLLGLMITASENVLTTPLPLSAHIGIGLACMTGFWVDLVFSDRFCAVFRWTSFCMLWLCHSLSHAAPGSRLRSRSGVLFLFLLWCIILSPFQVLFTTILEYWKPAPNPYLTFVPVNEIYQPPPGGGIDADVFAIHGLGSNATTAWKCRATGTEWLRDVLPKQLGFENIRVITLNHQSQWNKDRDITSLAESMLEEIIRKNGGQRRIFFIAHSFGGLLLKEALSMAAKRAEGSESTSEEVIKAKRVTQQTRGIFFLGTPHRGTSGFWAGLSCLITCTGQSLGSSTTLLQYMWGNNDYLRDLDKSFVRYLRVHRPYIGNFIEERKEMFGRWALLRIVDESQAKLNYQLDQIEGVKNGFLDSGHVGLNKFQSANDPNFQKFFAYFDEAFKFW